MINNIKPLKLWMRNFLSYGNSTTCIPLDFSKPTLIVGRNLDDAVEGQIDSNGSGKSTIINAVSYVLYNKTIGKNLEKDDLINNINKKNMMVSILFSKIESGTEVYYLIERYRKNKAKGGDGVTIYRNTSQEFSKEHDITKDSISQADEQIREILGMPFDVFSRIVIYSSSHPSFFSLPKTSTNGKVCQSDIIEEIFSVSILSKKADALHADLKKDKNELYTLQKMNEVIINSRNNFNAQLDNLRKLESEWDASHKSKILEIENKISKIKNIDFDKQQEYFDSIKSIEASIRRIDNDIYQLTHKKESLQKQKQQKEDWENNKNKKISYHEPIIHKYNHINFGNETKYHIALSSIKPTILDLQKSITDLEKDKKILIDQIHKLEKENSHLSDNKCPYCSQNYEQSKIQLEKNKQIICDANTKLSNVETVIENKKLELQSLEADITKIKSKLHFNSLAECDAAQFSYNQSIKDLDEIKNQKNPFIELHDGDMTEIEFELNELYNKKTELNDKIQEIKSKLLFLSEKELIESKSNLNNLILMLDSIELDFNPYTQSIMNMLNQYQPEDKTKDIEKLEDDILHKEFLYKLLTKKDSFIRKAILAQNLTYLNNRLKYRLDKIGLPHKVQFNFDMSTTISRFGNEISYENLSSGQEARINIALFFAFRDVLEKKHGKIPLCILDECLDTGLGNVGIQQTTKMIKDAANRDNVSMFVISHRDEIHSMFDSKIEIEYKSRFSKIVKSDIGVTEE